MMGPNESKMLTDQIASDTHDPPPATRAETATQASTTADDIIVAGMDPNKVEEAKETLAAPITVLHYQCKKLSEHLDFILAIRATVTLAPFLMSHDSLELPKLRLYDCTLEFKKTSDFDLREHRITLRYLIGGKSKDILETLAPTPIDRNVIGKPLTTKPWLMAD
jgi:hypothetical protein